MDGNDEPQPEQKSRQYVNRSRHAQQRRGEAQYDQGGRCDPDLAKCDGAIWVILRHHQHLRARIVIAVHLADCEKMGKLPKEKNRVEYPAAERNFVVHSGPSHQDGCGARKGPDESAKIRPALQGRVEQHVTE